MSQPKDRSPSQWAEFGVRSSPNSQSEIALQASRIDRVGVESGVWSCYQQVADELPHMFHTVRWIVLGKLPSIKSFPRKKYLPRGIKSIVFFPMKPIPAC